MRKPALAVLFSLLTAACGGSSSPSATPAPGPPPAPAPAPSGSVPGGLYVGHYQEDPIDNPENPEPGSFYLYLPETDTPFAGEMSFTYIGCQSSNVGTVAGTKAGLDLSGDWSGTVDGTPVGGPYLGRFESASQRYAGTYRNSGGKVRVTVPGCIDYYVASHGTWEMSPAQSRSPADFAIGVQGGSVSWTDVAGVTRWLASVYDELRAQGGANAVVSQSILTAVGGTTSDQTVPLALLNLQAGRSYVLAITAFGAGNQRVGYTSVRYVAP